MAIFKLTERVLVNDTTNTLTNNGWVFYGNLTSVEITALTGVAVGSKVYDSTTGKEQVFTTVWQQLALFADLTKTNVGLGNADNTTDLNKPISIATQSLINTLPTHNDLKSWQKEDFLSVATGNNIQYVNTGGGGGSSILGTASTNSPDVNFASPLKARVGYVTLAQTTANNSRSVHQTNPLFRTFPTANFGMGVEYCMANSALPIIIATDPTLVAVGFFDDMTAANPLNGFYVRPPRSTETNFYRVCVRVAGVETVVATSTAVYDSTIGRYVSIFLQYVGSSDTITATILYGGLTFISTILNFNTAFPAINSLNLRSCFGVNRNGTASVGVVRGITVDKSYLYIKTNY